MYVNNIGNRTMFKIKTGYYLNHLTPESMKLLGRYLKTKIVKIYLIQKLMKYYQYIATFLTGNINNNQEPCIHLFLINHLVSYQIFHPKILYFKKRLIQTFHYIELWIFDQSSKPLETEDKISITLFINQSGKYKK